MYTLNDMEDGSVELLVMQPKRVAVFYSPELASIVADRLNADLLGAGLSKFENVWGSLDVLPAAEDDGENDVVEADEDAKLATDVRGMPGQVEEHSSATDVFDTELEPLTPADADKLLEAIIASKTADVADDAAADIAVKEVAPTVEAAVDEVAAPRGEPSDADWADAFLAVEDGSDMAEVAATLGVTMPKLRGRYVAWKGAKKKAAAAPVAAFKAPIAPLPSVSAQKDEPKPLWWRELTEFLGQIGYRGGWSASLDLALVEGLANGTQLEVVADEIGKEVGEAKARFIALTPNGVTIERQTQLLQVLRARAGVLK
ncbi:hypothetical protein ACTTAK_06590 [Rhodobacter capsulatus]|uniref:hypothetical protein n=1 Tax=Rhodobacter capsulatus TaxID=1061 RepID=UPI001143A4B2|nr:hypothetical protein [Rhodobacter capsulatus]TQD37451.1 hypothetical protein FKW81_02405 [Rhodobacter capsulatus]